jgi:hypothetical protein
MIHIRFIIILFLPMILSVKTTDSGGGSLPKPITIGSKVISFFDRENKTRRDFGELEFMGGLELISSDSKFGGLSALWMNPDGVRFLALSDRAAWLRGRIVYDGERPAGIENAEIAPVIGPDQKPSDRWDTESLALFRNRLYLGVEGIDQIPVFFYDGDTFPVFREMIPFPPGVLELPKNGGIEAISFIPRGSDKNGVLVVFSEKGLDKDGNLKSYILEGADRRSFSVKRGREYDISDAVLLRSGRILILERKFDIVNGISVRLRRLDAGAIRPGALVDGPVIFEADLHCEIDNMEAVGVHRGATGKTILTLLSDDNFSFLQRTLLLQFALKEN